MNKKKLFKISIRFEQYFIQIQILSALQTQSLVRFFPRSMRSRVKRIKNQFEFWTRNSSIISRANKKENDELFKFSLKFFFPTCCQMSTWQRLASVTINNAEEKREEKSFRHANKKIFKCSLPLAFLQSLFCRLVRAFVFRHRSFLISKETSIKSQENHDNYFNALGCRRLFKGMLHCFSLQCKTKLDVVRRQWEKAATKFLSFPFFLQNSHKNASSILNSSKFYFIILIASLKLLWMGHDEAENDIDFQSRPAVKKFETRMTKKLETQQREKLSISP